MKSIMRFDVVTKVNMLMMVAWVVTPCKLVLINVLEKHTTSIFRGEN